MWKSVYWHMCRQRRPRSAYLSLVWSRPWMPSYRINGHCNCQIILQTARSMMRPSHLQSDLALQILHLSWRYLFTLTKPSPLSGLIQQITNDIFSYISQKTGLDTLCKLSPFDWRQFAWNVTSCFLGKIRKYFKMSCAENLVLSIK